MKLNETQLQTYMHGQNQKYWQQQMPIRLWSNRISYSLLVGLQNVATGEDHLMVCYKTKHSYHIILQSYPLVSAQRSHIQRSWEHMFKQNPHTDVYSSFIHNCQNLGATKMSFTGWKDKSTVGTSMQWNIIRS